MKNNSGQSGNSAFAFNQHLSQNGNTFLATQAQKKRLLLIAFGLVVALFAIVFTVKMSSSNNSETATNVSTQHRADFSTSRSQSDVGVAGGIDYLPSNGLDGAALALVDGKPLFPLSASGYIGQYNNSIVEMNGVEVQSVVDSKGMWVGSSVEQRVFIRFEGVSLGRGEVAISQINAGDFVNLSGKMKAISQDSPEVTNSFGLASFDNDRLLNQQAYVDATSIRLFSN